MNNYLLKNENSVFYECAYSCDNEIFLKIGDEKFFITDPRYEIEASEFLKDTKLLIDYDLIACAKNLLKSKNVKDIVFDGGDISYFDFLKLSIDCDIKFINDMNFSKRKRAIKSDEEIILLKEATRLNKSAFLKFEEFLNSSCAKSELDLYIEAKRIISDDFKYDFAFDPIVAVNENAAKAHARAGDKRLNKDDLILFDAGLKYKRYCSDRTRVAKFGSANFNNPKFEGEILKIYEIVKLAQSEAIKAIKPGIRACDIDKVARDVITNAGYKEFFTHSTGHGVGLDIHEFPIISKSSNQIIEKNMIFSVEPGIYLKNKFGIRIEDLVVVTKDGCEIL